MIQGIAILAFGSAALVFQNEAARTSQQQAAELIRLMSERQLSTVAAADPLNDGRFVAAMHIPGSQLLVIGSRYAAPSLLRERILGGDFRDLYIDLHASGEPEGRLFVIDSGADGLRIDAADGQPFDIVWRDGREQTMLNGDWKQHKLTKEQYLKRSGEQEAAYADMLAILSESLRGVPGQ